MFVLLHVSPSFLDVYFIRKFTYVPLSVCMFAYSTCLLINLGVGKYLDFFYIITPKLKTAPDFCRDNSGFICPRLTAALSFYAVHSFYSLIITYGLLFGFGIGIAYSPSMTLAMKVCSFSCINPTTYKFLDHFLIINVIALNRYHTVLIQNQHNYANI